MITEITPDGQEIQPTPLLTGKGSRVYSADEKEYAKKYNFTWFEDAKFPGFQNKEVQDLLFKWYK
jgi:hypothetical protein